MHNLEEVKDENKSQPYNNKRISRGLGKRQYWKGQGENNKTWHSGRKIQFTPNSMGILQMNERKEINNDVGKKNRVLRKKRKGLILKK